MKQKLKERSILENTMNKLLVILVLLSGCATFSLESPTGWKANYYRFWDQELSGVVFKMDKNGTVEGGIESQTSHQEKTIQLLLQTLLQGGK
jgi:hypothetical protein